MNTLPSYLKTGDTIGIVCTARKIDMESLQPALDILEKWGFKVLLGKSIFAEENQFAGSDILRAEDMQQMLDDENIKAIIVARGGYGTVRMIDYLDFTKFLKQPKWIIGYSDITVLHSHLNKLGVASLHATMPINFAKNTPEALQSLQNALMGEKLSYDFVSVKENKTGVASGILIGGNLSVLQSISGSISDIDIRDKILFLEDLDEYLYHIDRMMMQLKRSGKLQHLKGLLVGSFTEMKDNAIPFGKTAYEIIEAAVADYHFPVAYNIPAGHITDNRTLIMGAEVNLEVFKYNATLRF